MKTLRLPIGLAVGLVFSLAFVAAGQNRDTIYVGGRDGGKVTFYDFRSDRSNPEFEQPHTSGLRRNMVDSLLDKDNKPQMSNSKSTTQPYLNHGVRFWFRDNSKLSSYAMAGEDDPLNAPRKYLDKFRPIYMYGSNATTYPPYLRQGTSWGGEWNATPRTGKNTAATIQVPYAYAGSTILTNYTGGAEINIPDKATGFTMNGNYYTIDSAYQNIVFSDSLDFVSIGGGVYRYLRAGSNRESNQFFEKVNGKGFNSPATNDNPQNWIHSGPERRFNYAFTMELEWDFRYVTGQKFNFRGDDDVWVFVDGKLVMDIGGIHAQLVDSFYIDDLVGRGILNLSPGDKTTMRLFYVERHADDANIEITTNIITNVLDEMELTLDGDTLTAGVPIDATGIIWGEEVNDEDDRIGYNGTTYTGFNGTFRWRACESDISGNCVRSGSGRNKPDTARYNANATQPTTGDIRIWSKTLSTRPNDGIDKTDSLLLVVNRAYTYVTLFGTYVEDGVTISDSRTWYVKPGPAARVYIEAYPDSALDSTRWVPHPLDSIVLTRDDTVNVAPFYAILRDAYGNWVGPAVHEGTAAGQSNNTWATAVPTVATAANGTAVRLGEGKARRVSSTAGRTLVWVDHKTAQGVTLRDSSFIVLNDIDYVGIRVGVKVGGTFYQVPGDSILMILPTDTTLWVQLQRSDDRTIWEEAPANWKAYRDDGSTLLVPTNIPAGASYRYSPTAPVELRIVVGTNSSFAIADTVRIIAKYGTPVAMRFFNKDAVPTDLNDTLPLSATPMITPNYPPADTNHLYRYSTTTTSQAITVVAGVSVPITAAMFGTSPPAVNSYIPNGNLPPTGAVTWTIVTPNTGTAITESPTSEYSAIFRSTVAHQVHVVRATYTDGGATVTQELRIRVLPGAIAALYIESDSQEENPTSLNKPLTFNGSSPVLGEDGVIMGVNDTLFLDASETRRPAYALLRDKWGNYIGPSNGYYPYWATYHEFMLTPKDPPTTWTSDNDTVVNVASGSPSLGQGIVTRADTSVGETVIWAREETWPVTLNPAKLPVVILKYSYTELRVVEETGTGRKIYGPDDTLKITTNDEPKLVVQGKRSDCGKEGGPTGEACWEDVTGNWGRDGGLNSSVSPPAPGSSWTLDPRNPGEGNITVSRQGVDNGTPTTITAELPTVIKLGPPTSAVLVILTPADQIRAGDSIRAEIRYSNRTGPMTEWDDSWDSKTEDRAGFKDNQGLNGTTYIPKVGSESGLKDLGYLDTNRINARLKPEAGKAAVVFILYNAADNPHTLTYKETIADTTLIASATLTLLPGKPDRVIIVDGSGKDVGDSISIEHGENRILQTVGVDKWGNETGGESSRWCVPAGSSIPQSNATCNNNTPVIVYDTKDAKSDGCAWLSATPGDTSVKRDSVYVCIENVKLKPVYAVTRDYHGCGYINVIELQFDVDVKMRKDKFVPADDNSKIKLEYHHNGKIVTFNCDSVTTRGKFATLYINETFTQKQTMDLETDWTPRLTISSGLIDPSVNFAEYVIEDGVAPVIATALRFFQKDSRDRTKDYIEVVFSEKVRGPGGNFNLNTGLLPDSMFRIWSLDAAALPKVREKKLSKSASKDTKQYTADTKALAGIATTVECLDCASGGNTKFKITLSNGYDVGPPSHYINIKALGLMEKKTASSVILDNFTNVSDSLNRKVKIVYGNDPGGKMIPVPNPASPDRAKVGNSDQARKPDGGVAGSESYKYIGAYDNYYAIEHIKNGGGGAVFQVPIYVPEDANNVSGGGSGSGAGAIKCQVKVYDLAGNLVSSGQEDNLLSVSGSRLTQKDHGLYMTMDIFWSGYNSKGMKAAPGTYRIIVQISYPGSTDPKAKNRKETGTVGIAK